MSFSEKGAVADVILFLKGASVKEALDMSAILLMGDDALLAIRGDPIDPNQFIRAIIIGVLRLSSHGKVLWRRRTHLITIGMERRSITSLLRKI